MARELARAGAGVARSKQGAEPREAESLSQPPAWGNVGRGRRRSRSARCEKYPEDADVPNGVGLLTASVDVQSSGRLECVVKGWGAKEESWLIAYQQFFGDPGREEVWNELHEFLLTRFRHYGNKWS